MYFYILVTPVKIGFFWSAGSRNSRSQKISMWKILLILELFEDQKKKISSMQLPVYALNKLLFLGLFIVFICYEMKQSLFQVKN